MTEIDDQTLRALVRQAVAKHMLEPGADHPAVRPLAITSHVSHFRYTLPKSDGPCLIEPTVQCNHCGYCESHGH